MNVIWTVIPCDIITSLITTIIIIIIFYPRYQWSRGGFKKLLEKYENRYEKSIGAVISR